MFTYISLDDKIKLGDNMTKIYGITTTINLEELDLLTEEEVFEKILKLQTLIDSATNNDSYSKRNAIDKDFLEKSIYNLDYLTYYTRCFGVKFDQVPEEGKRIKDVPVWHIGFHSPIL